jgi:hypothetical protein
MALKKFFLQKNYRMWYQKAGFVADFKAVEKFAKNSHIIVIYKK